MRIVFLKKLFNIIEIYYKCKFYIKNNVIRHFLSNIV